MEEYFNSDWFKLIGGEFEKPYMRILSDKIKEERVRYTIYPKDTKDTFQVFRNTSPDTIKVVILGQDPYHDSSYDNRAFSNSQDKVGISPSLRNILKEVEEDIYDGFNMNSAVNPDLSRWEDQGVLLMNRVLTVRKGLPASHTGLGWETFTAKCINELSKHKKNLVFMLWGNRAKSIKEFIHPNEHLVLESGHPSPMSANRGLWFGNKHFSQTDTFLEEKQIDKIIW
jgi:uracil-DNA glycosylase